MEQKKDTVGKRLQWILCELGITPYHFSKKMGYKCADSIYHIINDESKVSDALVEKIKQSEYNINIYWLLTGQGEAFIYSLKQGDYGNEYSIDGKIIYPADLNFYFLKNIALSFAKITLGSDDVSYMVEVGISGIKGLEYRYTTYSFDNGHNHLSRYYSVIINPSWKVISFSDFWNIGESKIRCQDLLNLSDNINSTNEQQFTNALYKILNNIEWNDLDDAFLIPFNNRSFKELYKTDSRK